jgi:hypothetical protein
VTLALRAAAFVAVAFGVLTLSSGARVIFGDGAAAAGHYVPFIVWFNFLAGFAYVAAGVGLWLRWRWSAILATAIAVLTAAAFAALGLHIAGGGAYETRTIAAMTLRTLLWMAIAALAWRALKPSQPAQA